MRKDPEGRESRVRIYVTPRSKVDAAVLDALLRFGIRPTPNSNDKGTFYDVTLPTYWSAFRKRTFGKAIERAKGL